MLTFFVSKDQFLTIFHQNIAGLLNKNNLLQIYITDFPQKIGHELDIICLSETFLKPGEDAFVHLDGYTVASNYSRQDIRRGGVCILCRGNLNFSNLTIINKYQEESTFEVCGIIMPEHRFCVICIYRIPNSNVTVFLNKFQDMLYNVSNQYHDYKIILAGDFNIDTLKCTPASEFYRDILLNNNLTLHIQKPTRQKTCLDHIISNDQEAIGETHELGLSDHNTGQTLTVKFANKIKNHTKDYWILRRDYDADNIMKFKDIMAQLTFNDIYDEPDFDIAFSKFHDTIKLYYDLCFPIIKTKRHMTTFGPKWITTGLKKSCKTKRKLRYNYYTSRPNEKETNKTKYLLYTKILKKALSKSQKIINHKYVLNSKNKCKAAWDIIQNKTQGNTVPKCIKELNIKNETIRDKIVMAESLNDHFIHTPNELNQTDKTLTKNNVTSIFLRPTNKFEIKRVIMLLKNTLSVGYDDISTKILKTCADELSPVLSHLVNLSFIQGSFPTALKFSIVKPLHKKGDKNDLNNYRPITLVPILSKILEKIMYSRIYEYLTKFDILKVEQNGFQRNKSTTLAAYTLVTEITNCVDKGHLVSAVFFDMSKAFDVVCHNILIDKLYCYGIRGPALQWIKSYLSDRKQCVEINDIDENHIMTSYRSNYKLNCSGVPQGSVLGPLLFLLYVNDLPDFIKCKSVLFADDISIIISTDTKSTYNDKIMNSVLSVTEWLTRNRLKVNISKTKIIQFNLTKRKEALDIKLNGQKLEEVQNTKFLGIHIEDSCNWHKHIKEVCTKINKFIYPLRRLTRTSSQKSALLAYHGYVASVLRYGVILWGNGSAVNKAFIAQKKCVRAICGVGPLFSCRELFPKLKILTLPSIYIFELCMFVKKHSHFFTKNSEVVKFNTRYRDKLVLPLRKKATSNKGCYSMAIKVFNKLPTDMKSLPLNKFKNKLFMWLVNKAYYTVREFFNDKQL